MTQTIQVDPGRSGCHVRLSEAVAEAPDGATIQIAPGEYAESLEIDGKTLTFEGPANTEVRGGEQSAQGDTPAKPEVVLTGDGGWAPTVACRGGSLTLRNITVRANDADALRVTGGSLVAENARFRATRGNGLRLCDGAKFTVTDCAIDDSQVGILIEDADGDITGVNVRNIADDGIVVRLGAAPTIRNTKVEGAGGRGIYVYESAKPTIEGSEVTGCREEGISVALGAAPKLNLCKVIGAGQSGIRFAAGTAGELRNCGVERSGNPPIDIDPAADVDRIDGRENAAGLGAIEAPRGDATKVDELLAELDQMVGLDGVKAEVKSIIDEIQVNEWRRSAGLSVDGMSNHLIFAGAPGTGKTTVGRIYGQLLAALGVLPGGPLREVSRRDLVGQYIGHTAEKTAAVFDEAKGGVVFLDEAYTLTRQAGGGSNDFGQEAVDMIVKLMEDMRKDIAVIAAGYTNEMSDFLDANPGLASRFVKTIVFENYSAEDLTLIITRMMKSSDYKVDGEAHQLLLEHFERVPRDENFGNARDARKLFEKLRKVQSGRLRTLPERPDFDALVTITADDIRVATVETP